MNHFRSKYSLSRYFTPPKPVPLELDLVQLEGGGYAPAQFWGQTRDGQEVYIRYRGGHFSVTLENGTDVEGETCLLDVTIGPPFHGGMSVEQVCNYFGITINGIRPPLPAPGETLPEGCKDLSGRTTFYDAWFSSGLDTQKRFLTAALAAFPGATLMQPIFDQFKTVGYRVCPTVETLTSDFSLIVLGELTENTIARLAHEPLWDRETGDCVIHLRTSGIQYPIRKYGNDDAERLRGVLGRTIYVAGQVDDCLYGSFSVHSEFSTGDASRQSLLQKLDGLLDKFFPACQVDFFDLKTGQMEQEDSFVMHFDPAIVSWLDAGPDRWLSIENKGDWQSPRFAGSRLARVTS
ncbi:hypothetical protein [Bradyrhizobium daqingense]|uniref:hypothetical protein n=1 Tax=Bradyrhizobium daqingense TaxID=993502 RepID=UPI0038395BD4